MNDWYTAVTSAPRKQPTLWSTIASLQDAGFDPRVFAEPDTVVPVPVIGVIHKQRLGVWHNWVHAATYAANSGAEYCLVTQDDINIHPDTQRVLGRLFKNTRYSVISVYTPRAYSHENFKVTGGRLPPGLYPVRSKSLWGVVGLAYRRSTLESVLKHPLIDQWRGVKPALVDCDIVNSDVAIGKILHGLGVPIWFPTPSFGIHTAKFSSIPGHGSNDVQRNRNAEEPATHSLPLWDQLFPSL